MIQSNTIGEIGKAIASVQVALKPIKREREATIPTKSGGGYSYKYAALEDVIEHVRALLVENGLALVQMPGSVHTYEGHPYVGVTTLLVHGESGEFIGDTLQMPCAGDSAQSVGSAISYARRYGAQSIIGLVAEEDDDGKAATAPQSSGTPRLVRQEAPAHIKCPECGSSMLRKTRRDGTGTFWGCSTYPKCTGIVNEKDVPNPPTDNDDTEGQPGDDGVPEGWDE